MRVFHWIALGMLASCGFGFNGDDLDLDNGFQRGFGEFDLDFRIDLFSSGPAYFFRIDRAKDWNAAADSCGLRLDGSLHCWSIGEKGAVTVNKVDTGPWKNLVHGSDDRCALDLNNQAHCWKSESNEHEPAIDGQWKLLSKGDNRTCGIKTDGSIWCWGSLYFSYGVTSPETGDYQRVRSSATPTLIAEGTWRSVSAGSDVVGFLSYHRVFCGLRTDDTLWCWEVDLDAYDDGERSLKQIGSQPSWASVFTGGKTVCGLTKNRKLQCFQGKPTPLHTYPGEWLSFSMYGETLCGVQEDHSLWCWGALPGTGELFSSHYEEQRKRDWMSVSVGHNFVCAVKLDHSLYCLGLPGLLSFNGQFTADEPVLIDAQTLQ